MEDSHISVPGSLGGTSGGFGVCGWDVGFGDVGWEVLMSLKAVGH